MDTPIRVAVVFNGKAEVIATYEGVNAEANAMNRWAIEHQRWVDAGSVGDPPMWDGYRRDPRRKAPIPNLDQDPTVPQI